MMIRRALFAVLLSIACLALASCGGGGGSTAGIGVRVSPSSPLVETDGTQSFTAEVSGTADTAVTWSIEEPGGGTIVSTGDASATYTAPSVASTYHVVATSVADASKTGSAEARVYELPPDPP
jgi:hypothetical protein